MGGLREKAPVVAGGAFLLAVGTGIGIFAGSGGEAPSVVDPAKATQNPNAASIAGAKKQAETFCGQAPLGVADYEGTVGGELVEDLGNPDSTGTLAFSSNANTNTQRFAKAMAHNNAALATASRILLNEKGIAPVNVASEATNTFNQMNQNPTVRMNICREVVTRIIATPLKQTLSSEGGSLAWYKPGYNKSTKELETIDAQITNNTEPIEVLGIAAVAGSPNYDHDKAIAGSWGVTVQGDMIQKAQKQGNEKIKISKDGKHVKVTRNGHTQVLEVPKAGQNQDHRSQQGQGGSRSNNGNNTGNQTTGDRGGGTQQGNQGCGTTGRKNCGGGNGTNTGNEGGGSTTTSTQETPPPANTTPAETTPTPTHTTTTPPPTTTTPPTTTHEEGPKGEGPCDPKTGAVCKEQIGWSNPNKVSSYFIESNDLVMQG
jgi:hypothetical protein